VKLTRGEKLGLCLNGRQLEKPGTVSADLIENAPRTFRRAVSVIMQLDD
jgi:hypothetical protein